jgi:ABC-type antimicrobial peptide transport system permease subunit
MFESIVPGGMKDDEIVINEWLAKDLGVKKGDCLLMKWFVLEASRLVEKSGDFTVRSIVPIQGAAADRTLMPHFPGITDAEKCADWETGLPIDLKRVREKDEQYWTDHRGTPKAFVTLDAGKRMWANRFGTFTSVRLSAGAIDAKEIQKHLDPASLGLEFLDVKQSAARAVDDALDFGGLFAGLSFFLIAASIILTGLLFGLGVGQRSEQAGLLLAVGFTRARVRRIILAEGAIVAALGAILGTILGLAYTRGVVGLLDDVWSGAIAGFPVRFHATGMTMFMGACAGFMAALAAMWLAARRAGRASIRQLLTKAIDRCGANRYRSRIALLAGAVILGAGAGTIYSSRGMTGMDAAGRFFVAGALLLLGAMTLCYLALGRSAAAGKRPRVTFLSLALNSAGRRRKRSLTAAALLAIGIFLTVSINAFRLNPQADRTGTGGFELYATTSLPVFENLNTARGRKSFGLDEAVFDRVRVVQLRVKDGDDASCLNLNRPQQPRILGGDFGGLFLESGFEFASQMKDSIGEGEITAVADAPTLTWALKAGVGDVFEIYDDSGQTRRLRFTASIPSSIMQGSIMVGESDFLAMFPGEEGYRVLLIDVPPGSEDAVATALTEAGADVGMSIEKTSLRMARFAEVQNTYLSIFSVLGQIGLLVGAVGFGIVAARNILERRSELAAMRAMGLTRSTIRGIVILEHLYLIAWGAGAGTIAAVAAVLPILGSPDGAAAVMIPLLLLALVVVCCAAWTALAISLAMRGPLLAALRNE